MNKLTRFYRELRRRRVFAVVALYVVTAWALIEVGDMAIDSGTITGLTVRNLFLLAIIGLPLSLVAGWFYDITRQGIVRTPPTTADETFPAALRPRDYLLLLALLAIWSAAYVYVHTPVAVEKSIAIMPFENRGNDPENSHFAYGIHDDLMTQLQRIGDLKLIAQASVSKLDSDMSVQNVGLRLGAAFIMKGSVERVLDRIRVNVVLVEAADAKQAWSGSFDRELSAANLFDIRDEITTAITDSLQALLSPQESTRVFDLPTNDLDAVLHYMRGRKLMANRLADELRKAVQEFRTALEIDPEYALAWVGLADATNLLFLAGGIDMSEGFDIRMDAVERALALNDSLGEAHAARGVNLASMERMDEAHEAFLKAIELAPNYAHAYHVYAFELMEPANLEQRVALYYKAIQLDPMSSLYQLNLAGTLNLLGRTEQARDLVENIVETDPDFAHGYSLQADLNWLYGQLAESIPQYRTAIDRDPGNAMHLRALGNRYLEIRDYAAAAEIRQLMVDRLGPANQWIILLDYDTLMAQSQVRKALELGEGLPPRYQDLKITWILKANAHLKLGEFQLAREFWTRWNSEWYTPGQWRRFIDGKDWQGIQACKGAGVLMATGDEALGKQLLQESLAFYRDKLSGFISHTDRFRPLGVCYLVGGQYDKALDFFEKRTEHGHYTDWADIRQLPWWSLVPDQPRLAALDRKVESLLAEQRAVLHGANEKQ